MPRTERLCKGIEFTEVILNGVSVDRRLYRAYVLCTPGKRRKAGFVARRSVGGACERNRARRLLKEAYRMLRPELAEGGFKVVFVARKPFKNLKTTEVMADMAKVFEQHGLKKE
ncbi:MAG: ribonuclease P protein component [bacterium]